MTIRAGLLLLPFVLTGCALFQTLGSSPEAQCRRAADANPKVQDLQMKQMSAGATQPDLNPDIAVAKREAYLSCMHKRGLAPPGGVEPVAPRY
jgi:hypothetical protein